MRLIDADALKEKAFGKRGGLIHAADIDNAPTIQPTGADCWGCNCQKMERLKEQKTFSEMVHLHDTETHDKRAETHACDLISRQAAIDAIADYLRRVCLAFSDYMTDDESKECATCILQLVPSAQPETARRIVGKSRDGMTMWYQCDMCNEPVDVQDSFCRGCGRRLTDG